MADMAGNMEAATGGIPPQQHTNITYSDYERRVLEECGRYPWGTEASLFPGFLIEDLDFQSLCSFVASAFENPRRMTINVEHVNGERFKIDVANNNTMREVKRKVAKRVNMSEDECILLYRRKELGDFSFLFQTDIQDGSTINLLPRTGNGLLDTVTWLFTGASKTISNLVDWVPGFFRDTSKTLTEKDLGRIANAIGRGWEVLGNELGLAPALIDQISEDKNSTVTRILYMLLNWRIQNPLEATVGRLRLAMKACSQVTFNWKAINRVFTGI